MPCGPVMLSPPTIRQLAGRRGAARTRRSRSRSTSGTVSYVTTTGFSPAQTTAMKQALEDRGWVYEASLTSHTSVLVVNSSAGHTGSSSAKLEQALRRPHVISTVSAAWVTDGRCLLKTVRGFAIHEDLLWSRVSTTSLDESQRAVVEDICRRSGGTYATSLCRKCRWLVVADGGTTPLNEKMLYAEKHSNIIKRISFSEFVSRYWRDDCAGGDDCVAPGSAALSSGKCIGDVVTAAQREAILQRASHRSSSVGRQPTHALGPDMSKIVCYCTPASLVTAEVRHSLQVARVHRVPMVTPATTHVIVLGEWCNTSIFPRPGLTFVSMRWVLDCIEQCTLLAEDVYRVALPYCPTITFGSLSDAQRELAQTYCGVGGGLASSSSSSMGKLLPCRVQDALLLGPAEEIQKSMGAPYAPTTHLIVPKGSHTCSEKVRAWARRSLQSRRHECYLVDFEWVVASVKNNGWVDVEPYVTGPSTVMAAMREQQPLEATSGPGKQRREARDSSTTSTSAAGREEASRGTSAAAAPAHADDHGRTKFSGGEQEESSAPLSSPQRLSFDAEQLNQSLEALVGRLEQRAGGAGSERSGEGATMHRYNPPPPFQVAADPKPASCIAGNKQQVSDSIVIGPSFTTTGGFSPLGSKDSATGFTLFPTLGNAISVAAAECAEANTGGGAGRRASPRAWAPPPESQFVVYNHDNDNDEKEEDIPDEADRSRPGPTVLGLPAAGSAPTPTPVPRARQRLDEITTVKDAAAQSRYKLLLAKTVRDDEALVTGLRRLGASIVNTPEEATHYIVPKPSKTETFLCCLAKGLWILNPSFATASVARGALEEEEHHEWTESTNMMMNSGSVGGNTTALIRACRTQRRRGGGAFKRWDVVYLTCTDAARSRSFLRVLRCGGCPNAEVTTREALLRRCYDLADPATNAGTVESSSRRCVLTDDKLWDDASLQTVQDSPLGLVVWRMEYLVHVITVSDDEQRPVTPRNHTGHHNVTSTAPRHHSGGVEEFRARSSTTLRKRTREET